MSSGRIAVVVPAHNAARTVGDTVRRLPASVLPGLEVVMVDDGSRDATAAAAERALVGLGLPYEIVRHGARRGYGAAQKSGFRRSLARGADVHAVVHADGQYAPEELPLVVAPLLDDRADVCVGSRILACDAVRQGMPVARYLGNRLLSFVENGVFGLDFVEYHSGYVAYTSAALRRIPFQTLTDRFHFDGEMLLAAGKLGLRVAEVAVSTHFGEESSSLAPLPYVLEVAGTILRYLRNGFVFQRGPRGLRG